MFFRGKVEEQLCECPLQLEKVRFNADIDMEEFMISVEEGRITKLYPHQQANTAWRKVTTYYTLIQIGFMGYRRLANPIQKGYNVKCE